MKLSEIAERMNCNPTMVLRLLRVLEDEGWICRLGNKGPYQMTARPLHFVSRAVGINDLVHLSAPILKKIVERTNSIAVISVPGQDSATCLAFAQQNESVGVSTRIGCGYPYHASAPGKILLAFSPLVDPEEIIRRGLEPFTPNTITTPARLHQELEQVRQQGYAIDNEEAYQGIFCLNVPLYNYQNQCMATLGISTLAYRFTLEEYVGRYRNYLLSAALKISRSLGYITE